MKKYYGFDGSELIYIGKYKDISPALEDSEKLGDFFYITTLRDWSLFAQKIIGTLAINAKN